MTGEFPSEPLPRDPMAIAAAWLQEARERRLQPNPDAMVIATTDDQGNPSARVVLCKEIVTDPGYLVFYTNYASRKGLELASHPRAAIVMYWDSLDRQLRVEGPVVKSPPAESDVYFAARPWQSRIGAWASQQSQPVQSRSELLGALARTAARFGVCGLRVESATDADADVQVPRPPHWGGYRLWAESVELWVQGDYRIHDRVRWIRSLRKADDHSFTSDGWTATRLQP